MFPSVIRKDNHNEQNSFCETQSNDNKYISKFLYLKRAANAGYVLQIYYNSKTRPCGYHVDAVFLAPSNK